MDCRSNVDFVQNSCIITVKNEQVVGMIIFQLLMESSGVLHSSPVAALGKIWNLIFQTWLVSYKRLFHEIKCCFICKLGNFMFLMDKSPYVTN